MSMQTTGHKKRTDGEPLLTVRGLKKHFDQSSGVLDRLVGDTGSVRAVDGVDLTVHEGETLAIVGESGCGKSTLGRTVLNLHDATAGSVTYRDEEISELSAGEMRPYRRNLQMIFQDPLASLNPRQTVGEILTAPMEVHGIGADGEERLERAKELLQRVGLKPAHIDRYPNQFSGGQQQRVGIARALSLEPDLIIADEPVSALDVSVQAQILNLLDELQDDFGLSLVFIAHNLSVVRHVADRVAVMYLGKVVETAPVEELYDDPQHPYTKSLLSAVPRIDPGDRDDRIILEGTVPSPLNPPTGCRFHTRCPMVIPPEDWAGSEENFRAAFTFRNRVLSGELDPDAAKTRLSAEGKNTDDETVASYLVEQLLPCNPADLPPNAADAVWEAGDALATEQRERAEEVVTAAFPSPCERETPQPVSAGEGHVAACHRVQAENNT
ncbi:peptide/nickel transport system ATP-binding protein [Haladaptatus litoreus]|uniref:Peptide/nickel transport system ATP-binding protein n=1 Tax=Haladaptatus litoreus TaxID=553468 RepID=A0A1N7DZS2_9EURY|nr:oligopeptide/dipeptide ABC transporter ATP-binding protein [Haladaptatus litoreus]SIR81357.1 peptide/nickel transport system ATP-binding protein [Haladaptatus litoreus]